MSLDSSWKASAHALSEALIPTLPNAYNPDIAAQMRTNVRKQAAMVMTDPKLVADPARTSENVRMALSHSEITGPAGQAPRLKISPDAYFPR